MIRYNYFLEARLVNLSNSIKTPTWPNLDLVNYSYELGKYRPDEWFWAMLELIPTWPNFDFDQLFMWIGANHDQIRLPRGQTSDFEQCWNPTPIWAIFTFGQLVMWIWTHNDQISLPRGQLSEFEPGYELTPTWPNVTLVNLYVNWANNYHIWLPIS